MQPQKILLTPYWILAAAMIGIADTAYLAYYHLLGIQPGCLLKGCEVVLQSPYAKVFDVPLSYLGLVFYAYMFLLAILLAIDPNSRGLRIGLLAYSIVGVLSSLTFIFLQLFVIHAICQYCMISAVTTFTLFGIAVWHWRSTK